MRSHAWISGPYTVLRELLSSDTSSIKSCPCSFPSLRADPTHSAQATPNMRVAVGCSEYPRYPFDGTVMIRWHQQCICQYNCDVLKNLASKINRKASSSLGAHKRSGSCAAAANTDRRQLTPHGTLSLSRQLRHSAGAAASMNSPADPTVVQCPHYHH